MDGDSKQYTILILIVFFAMMLAACTTSTEATPSTLPPTHTPLPSSTSALLTESSTTELGSTDVDSLRLRIEYSLTANMGELAFSGMEDALSIQIVEARDSSSQSANPDLITLGLGGAEETSMVVEIEMPLAENRNLTITSKNNPPGGSFASFYLLPDDGGPILIHQLDHRWWDSGNLDSSQSTFTIELGQLASLTTSLITPTITRDDITCGQVILADTTLMSDLSCPREIQQAIIVRASDVILDLGGHVLSGAAISSDNPNIGVFANEVDGVTIKNGTIEGFDEGIFIMFANHVLMENLTFRNLEITDPDHNTVAVHFHSGKDVIVRDSLLEYPQEIHKGGVLISDAIDVDVNNIEVHGGAVGISFGFVNDCDQADHPTNGTIRNNRLFNMQSTGGLGIWVQCTTSTLVTGNILSDILLPISGDAPNVGDITGLVVEGNEVRGAIKGIGFYGAAESRITNNVVRDSHFGIVMDESYGCLVDDPIWKCHYATGNVIENNVALGNGIADLYHHPLSTGNTWGENVCETTEGVEVPDCVPPNP